MKTEDVWGLTAGVLFFLGLVTLALGLDSKILLMQNGGLLALGAGIVVAGLQTLLSGQFRFQSLHQLHTLSAYSELLTRLLGAGLAFIGLALAAAGILRTMRLDRAVQTWLADFSRTEPGISAIAALAGLVALVWGLMGVVGTDEQNRSASAIAWSIPSRLVSALIAVVGAALITFAILHLASPGLESTLWESLQSAR